ncbi:MAG: fumarylacetoacetate hydrolase family protein [Yonghaparkia sp.]|nr:fumarylacetoacetate hydrolase family protein [Microcella sp.]
MRLVSYEVAGSRPRPGYVRDGQVIDLDAALRSVGVGGLGEPPTMRGFLERHGNELAAITKRLAAVAVPAVAPLPDVRLLPPVDDPRKVLCVGLNYSDHVAETGRALPEHPDVFAKFASSLIGHEAPMAVAALTLNLDFEGELAVIIARELRAVGDDEALSGVAGITIMNDTTARDLQYRGTQWLLGKAVDGSTPLGPWLVTVDEIDDVQNLQLTTRVNGVEMQSASTRSMIFSVARIIAELSRTMTLLPGDVIATGTPQGIGAKRTPPVWLQPGDVVEVELEGVGILRNRVSL